MLSIGLPKTSPHPWIFKCYLKKKKNFANIIKNLEMNSEVP